MKDKSLVKSRVVFMFFFISTSLFSQGAWDLKYISIDSLNSSFINKEVRLDFKTSKDKPINGKVSVFDIRKLLSKQDTVNLDIKGRLYKFIENWKTYVDHGVLTEQTLVSVNQEQENDKKLVIREMFVVSIDNSTLTLKISIYPASSCKKTKEDKKSEELEIVISKSILKGVLLRV
jgi:hypothetical protein